MEKETKEAAFGGALVATLVLGAVCLIFIVHPIYKVWSYEKDGQAELAQATFNRQIKVQEAIAAEEAAKSLAQAEIIRAQGVAKANQIIGDSLKGNEVYLHYLWIHGLQDTKNQIVYIPTEANLPILEANRSPRAEKEK